MNYILKAIPILCIVSTLFISAVNAFETKGINEKNNLHQKKNTTYKIRVIDNLITSKLVHKSILLHSFGVETGDLIAQESSINPNDAKGYNSRGLLYRIQGKMDLALSDFNQALKINPDFAEALVNVGLLYVQKGNIEAARTNLKKAHELFIAQNNMVLARQVSTILKKLP